jgi:hypothetical protein
MRFVLIMMSVMLTMQKCSNNTEIIESSSVQQILILVDSTSANPYGSEKKIIDKESISSIVKQLNSCSLEPIKFYPTHRIRIIYNNGVEEVVLLNGNVMKYKGHTYRLNKSIRTIIE